MVQQNKIREHYDLRTVLKLSTYQGQKIRVPFCILLVLMQFRDNLFMLSLTKKSHLISQQNTHDHVTQWLKTYMFWTIVSSTTFCSPVGHKTTRHKLWRAGVCFTNNALIWWLFARSSKSNPIPHLLLFFSDLLLGFLFFLLFSFP